MMTTNRISSPALNGAVNHPDVEVLKLQESDRAPYVVHFPSGFSPNLVENGVHSTLDFKCFENSKSSRVQKHMLVAHTHKIDFVGSNVNFEGQTLNSCQYVLGVLNKKINKFHVIPITAGKVLRMEPRVRGVSYDTGIMAEEEKKAKEAEEGGTEGSTERREMEDRRLKRKSLTEAFGSKRKKRAEEALERGAVTEENIAASAAINQLVQQASRKEGMLTVSEIESKLESQHVRNIPPYDVKAHKPELAYPIEGVISGKEWSKLRVEELVNASQDEGKMERIRKFYPTFVTNRMHRIRVEDDKAGNASRAKLLMYITYLLRFYRAPASLSFRRKAEAAKQDALQDQPDEAAGKEEAPEYTYTSNDPATVSKVIKVPVTCVEHFIEQFSTRVPGTKPGEGETIIRPNKQVHLLLSTVLVLALHVDGFLVDPEDLAKDFRMNPSALIPHFLELGCKVVKETGSSKRKITLPVPLTFRKTSRGPR